MLREKAAAMSDALKQAFGFPIDPAPPRLPVVGQNDEAPTPPTPPEHPHPHHPKHKHKRHRCKSFFRRLHRALIVLKPWEGRVMAFIIGCGIGVLVRMVWVMTVVTYRMIKGRREEPEYFEIVYDAEDVVIPPPLYISEKIDHAVDIKTTPADAT